MAQKIVYGFKPGSSFNPNATDQCDEQYEVVYDNHTHRSVLAVYSNNQTLTPNVLCPAYRTSLAPVHPRGVTYVNTFILSTVPHFQFLLMILFPFLLYRFVTFTIALRTSAWVSAAIWAGGASKGLRAHMVQSFIPMEEIFAAFQAEAMSTVCGEVHHMINLLQTDSTGF